MRNCDSCDAGIASAAGEEPFAVGAAVEHEEWGQGTVQRDDDHQMTVLFESAGCKTLSVSVVVDRELLHAAAPLEEVP